MAIKDYFSSAQFPLQLVSSTAMAMEDSSAYFGVTDYGDYVDFLPSTSATSYFDEDNDVGSSLISSSGNNCTQAIKQVSLEPQPLRMNPIYIKVTVFYRVSHPLNRLGWLLF